eukprot:TRINITY_DN1367_c0_g1_i1.p1 TRINITY_DN1367_c0_g1~~TRINITY_DN1367_c0_g1_i1.p1  ORF type:complete len:623 (+),score=134.11 TRINITY_DN1367_c0_g1_i1:129-1997(+)
MEEPPSTITTTTALPTLGNVMAPITPFTSTTTTTTTTTTTAAGEQGEYSFGFTKLIPAANPATSWTISNQNQQGQLEPMADSLHWTSRGSKESRDNVIAQCTPKLKLTNRHQLPTLVEVAVVLINSDGSETLAFENEHDDNVTGTSVTTTLTTANTNTSTRKKTPVDPSRKLVNVSGSDNLLTDYQKLTPKSGARGVQPKVTLMSGSGSLVCFSNDTRKACRYFLRAHYDPDDEHALHYSFEIGCVVQLRPVKIPTGQRYYLRETVRSFSGEVLCVNRTLEKFINSSKKVRVQRPRKMELSPDFSDYEKMASVTPLNFDSMPVLDLTGVTSSSKRKATSPVPDAKIVTKRIIISPPSTLVSQHTSHLPHSPFYSQPQAQLQHHYEPYPYQQQQQSPQPQQQPLFSSLPPIDPYFYPPTKLTITVPTTPTTPTTITSPTTPTTPITPTTDLLQVPTYYSSHTHHPHTPTTSVLNYLHPYSPIPSSPCPSSDIATSSPPSSPLVSLLSPFSPNILSSPQPAHFYHIGPTAMSTTTTTTRPTTHTTTTATTMTPTLTSGLPSLRTSLGLAEVPMLKGEFEDAYEPGLRVSLSGSGRHTSTYFSPEDMDFFFDLGDPMAPFTLSYQ